MKVRFNELPRRVREQLVAVTTGQNDPRVLAAAPSMRAGWFKYFTAIGGVAAAYACIDFVLRRSNQDIRPYSDREVFLGLAAALFVAVASIVGIVYAFKWKAPPYREGEYVFASGLVQLKHGEVSFSPIAELGRPTLVQVRRNGSYQHTRLELGHPFTFYYNGQGVAEEACTRILRAKAEFIRMIAARDAQAIYAVDPFAECTVSGQWTAPPGPIEEPTAPVVPKAARLGRWLGALVVGIATSGILYLALDSSYQDSRVSPASATTSKPTTSKKPKPKIDDD